MPLVGTVSSKGLCDPDVTKDNLRVRDEIEIDRTFLHSKGVSLRLLFRLSTTG